MPRSRRSNQQVSRLNLSVFRRNFAGNDPDYSQWDFSTDTRIIYFVRAREDARFGRVDAGNADRIWFIRYRETSVAIAIDCHQVTGLVVGTSSGGSHGLSEVGTAHVVGSGMYVTVTAHTKNGG